MVGTSTLHKTIAPLAWWIDLEFLAAWQALLLFAALAAPVVWLGMRSMAGLGPVRQWVSIALRLAVLLVLVLIIGGARWQRQHRNVETLVLRDISHSTRLARNFPGRSLADSIDEFLIEAAREDRKPHRDDRIGVISFSDEPRIDWIANTSLFLDARAIRDPGDGTDIASAIQLALATFRRDAMQRILLITDGNSTKGDLKTALDAAIAQKVPIDVMPLQYRVDNEVLVERVSAPSVRRESDAFDVSVTLLSTNKAPVSGTLEVLEEQHRLEQRRIVIQPATPAPDGRLEPRKHVERFRVPPVKGGGVRRFKAIFTPDVVNAPQTTALAGASAAQPGDTLLQNNTGSAFTFVHGQGRILYVDNSLDGGGRTLMEALTREGLNVERVTVDQVPAELVLLQNYDAIILNNVSRGPGGLTEAHDPALAAYVHDFGGGLIMIGGPNSFGAGGWQASRIEQVMPVDMDIPAQRQLPKGALVIIVHSCEMPNGNYWGEQCAIKAVETLSSADEVGVISFDFANRGLGAGGINGSVWNFPLQVKGDGSRAIAAIKRMQPQDMPSFEDTLELALNGAGGLNPPCLRNSNAAAKHVIIISDGDPQPPRAALLNQYIQQKISISTVSVYPHQGFVPPTMQNLARATGGRFYGPIEQNPSQLPQIFIKEATVVRRTLIQESREPPIRVSLTPSASDAVKGIAAPPPVFGIVLTQKKPNPTVEMPMVASIDGTKIDPLFAHWQAGLGRAAAFTSDAGAAWNAPWLTGDWAENYGKFWSQTVRMVSRPPMSGAVSVNTERVGDRATVTVEATDKAGGFASSLTLRGTVFGPDGTDREIRLVPTGPGTYSGEFPVSGAGNYVVRLAYSDPQGQQGWAVSGLVVNESPELRELRSNDLGLEQVAMQTGGRILTPFDAANADLFSRQGLVVGSSPLPVWDILIPILLALVLMDVASRRIAWDWAATKKLAAALARSVREFTLTRPVESKPTLDALRRVRDEVAETRFKAAEQSGADRDDAPLPDRKAKFEAKEAVEGDITQVVGGATSKPVPPPPKEATPKGMQPTAGSHTLSLLEAKRRAQQKIREKEQGQS